MESGRVKSVDIAEKLGVSTAFVSNVIHGKIKKISDEMVKRVWLSVPENISVIGFDNVREYEKFVPALTTIKQDNKQRVTLTQIGGIIRWKKGNW